VIIHARTITLLAHRYIAEVGDLGWVIADSGSK
jgi:hypothetical protein